MSRAPFVLIANIFLLLVWPLRALRARRAAGRLGWIHLVVDGPVSDLPRAPGRLASLLRGGGGREELSLVRLRKALELAAKDPRVRGLLVTLRSFDGGAARAESLREELQHFRRTGKRVIVYLPHGAALRELFVASGGDELWLDPAAPIALLGLSVAVPYVADALERAGVRAEVLAQGKYKTAAEGFARREMSDAQREQLGALLDDLYETQLAALSESRRVAREQVERWVDESPWPAPTALAEGLVDALVTDQELYRRLDDTLKDLEPVGIGSYARRRRVRFIRFRKPPYLAVVNVHGAIVSRAQTSGAASEENLVHELERVRTDAKARAVVLHVDSRGGSALASSRILRAVRKVASEKPVVAYFCDAAASGGYMIGCGARTIVAQPGTLTGSIGVVAAKPVAAELLARVGVHVEVLRRGVRADMFSVARGLTGDERAAFEREMAVIYDDFVAQVAEGRGIPEERVRELAEGRVWSGRAAEERGLVDRLGGFEVALDEARSQLGEAGRSLRPRRIFRAPFRPVPLRLGGLGQALVSLTGGRAAEGIRNNGGVEGLVAVWTEHAVLSASGERVWAYDALTGPDGLR